MHLHAWKVDVPQFHEDRSCCAPNPYGLCLVSPFNWLVICILYNTPINIKSPALHLPCSVSFWFLLISMWRSVLSVHWKDWCWSWNSNTLATWWEELTHLKRPWCRERLKTGGEGDNRGLDDWMASLTQWRWVWVDSRCWWWTGRPCMMWSMGLQRVGHNWETELNWTEYQSE